MTLMFLILKLKDMDSKAQFTPCINMKSTDSIATSQLQCPWFNSELNLLSVWSFAYSSNVHMGFLWVRRFPPTSQKHAGRLFDSSKFHLGVNVVLSRVYSWLMPSIPRMSSWSTVTMTRIKQLLKMKELTCNLYSVWLSHLSLMFIYIQEEGLDD